MKKPKLLTKQLPKPLEKTKCVTARVPESLFNDVKKLAEKQGYTWSDIVRAACEAYLDEYKKD